MVSVSQDDWTADMSKWIANNVPSPLDSFFDIQNQDGIIVLFFREESDALTFKLTFKHLY